VSAAFGIEDPDWSELSLETTLLVGRPGIVLLREYLAALRLQLDDAPIEDCSSTAIERAFVLVICARYGLRLREAAGLFRRDLIDLEGGAPVILVQGNSVRGLKSERSRRHIPSLEQLGEIESGVIAEVLRRWEHREGKDPDTPLLDIEKKHFKAFLAGVGEDLRALLKQVTGRMDTTTHFLRHGFAMRALAMLYGRKLGDDVAVDLERTVHLRRVLLGSDGVDRRLLWAVARLLGHASPTVTLYSYLNCLYMWLPQLQQSREVAAGIAMNLDKVPVNRQYLASLRRPQTVPALPQESVMARLLRFSRLIAIGQPEHAASRRSRLQEEIAKDFCERLELATRRLADDSNRTGVFKLLGGVNAQRLAEHANRLRSSPVQAADVAGAWEGQWLTTIGRSRQIVLCDESSIDVFARFLATTRLGPADLWVIKPRRLHASLSAYIEARLTNFVHKATALGQTFQLDAARLTLNGRDVDVPDRVVAVPARPGRQVRDSFELLVMWLTYLTAVLESASGGSSFSSS
jgi:integrase